MFVAYQCGPSCSTVPLTEYANNKIYQELPKEINFFNNTDEKLYVDMRRSKIESSYQKNEAASQRIFTGRILLYSIQQRHDNVL